MTDIEIGIMVKNMAREMVGEMRTTAKNGKTDRELMEVWEKSQNDSDIIPNFQQPKYGLTKDEERRMNKLAQAAGRMRQKEIGHERGKRIAEDRRALSGK